MKKKFYYAGMLAAGLLTFASCNNDEDPIVGGEQTTPTEETSGTEIILQVANSGDGLTTRAGRPLYSSEAKQDIDEVKVFFVNAGTVALAKTFPSWMLNSTEYTTDGHGRQQTWKLSVDELSKLTDGVSYKVYAVGYTTPAESIYNENAYLTEYVAKETGDWNIFKATVANDALGEEIFAGEIASLKLDGGEFDLTTNPEANVLTLHRQVSGLMGYFTNIPVFKLGGQSDLLSTMAEGQTNAENNAAEYKKITNSMQLRLVASNRSNTIMFAHFNSDFTSAEESDAMYVINGWQGSPIEKDAYFATAGDDAVPTTGTKDAYSIYTIDLKDWFPNGDVTGDGILGEADAAEGNGDNWVSPAENNQEIAGFKPGSVFAGNFIIPFEKESGVNTLQLQLIGYDFTIEEDQLNADQKTLKAGTSLKVLRTWNINLRSDDPQIGTVGNNAHMVTLDHTKGEPTGLTSGEEKANSYSLVRNHLYSVGEKGTDGYNPDTDIPEDLSRNMNLILRVNDNWELIHRMEVE